MHVLESIEVMWSRDRIERLQDNPGRQVLHGLDSRHIIKNIQTKTVSHELPGLCVITS